MNGIRSLIGKAQGSRIWWFLPIVVFLGFFYLFPLFQVFKWSFTNASLLALDYVYTARNYIQIFTSSLFHNTLRVTAIFVGACIVGQLGIGQLVALSLHHGENRQLWGTVLTRTVVLAGWVIPAVVAGIIWNMLLSSAPFGFVNYVIQLCGFKPLPFLHSPIFGLVSIIIANIWRGTAFSMILQYAGLKQIPQQLYEAAKVDGASPFQQYHHITLPQLRSVIFINLVLITVGTFNTFELILPLTGGGPGVSTEVLALSTYNQVFRSFNLGRGASYAVVLFVINLTLTVIYYRFLTEEG